MKSVPRIITIKLQNLELLFEMALILKQFLIDNEL